MKDPCITKGTDGMKDPCITKGTDGMKDPCIAKGSQGTKNPCITKDNWRAKAPCITNGYRNDDYSCIAKESEGTNIKKDAAQSLALGKDKTTFASHPPANLHQKRCCSLVAGPLFCVDNECIFEIMPCIMNSSDSCPAVFSRAKGTA
jgi:hypothetical protein